MEEHLSDKEAVNGQSAETISQCADNGAPEKAEKKTVKRRRHKGGGSLQLEPTGIYTVRAYINGKRVSKSTGTSDREEAERFLQDYLRPYVKGDAARTYENIQALVESDKQRAEREEDEKPQLTLDNVWDAYLASPKRRDLAETTLEGKRVVYNNWRKWMTDNFPEVVEVRRVTPDQVGAFLDYLRRDHCASTYNNRLCVLREMFRAVQEKARLKKNPWEGIQLRADDSHTRRELTIEELQRLVECASRAGDEWRKLFGIGIYTGLRLGDCCRLNWGEVDIVRSIIQVIPHKTRKYAHGKPVTVPIHPVLSQMFQETPLHERTGYVIPTIAGYYLKSRPKVSYQLQKIFMAAGIVTSVKVEGRAFKAPEATFHSLRHTFVSMSANAGVPLHIVQSIVGHESTAMTRHYYHENEAALRQAVAAIPSIGETAAANNSPLPFCPAEPVAVIPDSMKQFDPEKKQFVQPQAALPAPEEERKEPIEIPAENVVVEPRSIDKDLGREPTSAADPVVHPRVGGAKARPRPPKTQWFGEVMRIYAKRRNTGVLEGTMKLVGNGGYKFLQEIWESGAHIDSHEALDAMEAYLVAKGAQ